jgi:hypothetical protein
MFRSARLRTLWGSKVLTKFFEANYEVKSPVKSVYYFQELKHCNNCPGIFASDEFSIRSKSL